jgi:hypothetical protein
MDVTCPRRVLFLGNLIFQLVGAINKKEKRWFTLHKANVLLMRNSFCPVGVKN